MSTKTPTTPTQRLPKREFDKVGVSTAQSDTGLDKAHTTTNTVTDSDRTTPEDGLNDVHKLDTDANSTVSLNVINKVGPDVKDDNDAAKAADDVHGALNDGNNDAQDKNKDKKGVPMVSNKVGSDVKDDNDAAKAADKGHGALINGNNTAPDEDKEDTGVHAKAVDNVHGALNDNNTDAPDKDKDKNGVPMVSLY